MNPHHFSLVKVLRSNGRWKYFTGAFRKRRFPRICRFFGISEIVPVLSDNEREAEFHLSPSETYEYIARLRTSYPRVRWFYDIAYLADYINTAMQDSFIILVRLKDSEKWHYYIAGAHIPGEKNLSVTDTLSKATPMDIDVLKTTCQAIHINYKNYNYKAIPKPQQEELNTDGLEEYLEKNPPRSMFMTFRLDKK